jgi:CO dehydrogenase/acetyl-CoA synthase alpha subunit
VYKRQQLKRANEKLKPLGKKKYLEIYVDFKKRSKKLKQHLSKLSRQEADLPEKVRARIIKKADALIVAMKKVGKKPKKKTYKSLSLEVQSLTKKLRDASS